MNTVPARQSARPANLRHQPRVLLDTRQDKQEAITLRQVFARQLVSLRLSREFGVYIAPVGGCHGVFLGRHDGGPIIPSAAVIEAAERFASRPGSAG